ncbi:unnamed protein product [Adineta steineri]|uniref:Uncharacterized protein n=1 Tax=Adineta steineri TaxID=433720 RepID=A0A818FZJ0_9BILA|nr:unnamed protein product [Adineta steineri]CAF3481825.1 unnamed protein product [Adineta steineri]
MSTPFAHTHISHLTRMKRRRSQSLTLPNVDQQDTPGQSTKRKHFLAQLRKEHRKQENNQDSKNEEQTSDDDDDDEHEPVVTRVPGAHTSMSKKKQTSSSTAISVSVKQHMSSTLLKALTAQDQDEFQPTVTRISGISRTASMKKHTSSTATKKETTSTKKETTTTHKTTYQHENEENYDYNSDVNRISSESTKSLKQQPSITAGKNSITNAPQVYQNSMANVPQIYQNPIPASPISYKDIDFTSSQTSDNPYATSSTNIMSKSDQFDQEFHLGDSKDHARRNDTKDHGSIKINGREKYYNVSGGKRPTKSSASYMTAIIAIIVGVIAFALGLTAFILVLMLRSTVYASLTSNSTQTSSSGTFPSSCSSYTTLNDPTRGVTAPGYALGCDNTAPFLNRTAPVWIRFMGTGGTTLPLTPPGLNLCGSTGTGWYAGAMPSSGAMVNGTVCFNWDTAVCRYSSFISVVNCGSFYIYNLPPAPACMMRYCTI